LSLNSIKGDEIIELIKGLVGVKNTQVLGLDIGLSQVKMANVIPTGNGYKLTRYVALPLPEATLIEDEIQKEEELKQTIVNCLEEIDGKNKQICLGLFGPNSVVRKIQLPGGSEEEIEDQVLWEAEQYLPFPVDESNIDQYIIGENAGGGVDVVVGAARQDMLLTYKGLVEDAGAKVKIVDLSAIALSNIFEFTMADEIQANENSSWLILDLGAQKTICIIYKDGMPMFIKEIQIGGVMITEEIQRQLGVNYQEAEDLKTIVDENGNLPEEISTIIRDLSTKFISEIKKVIEFYVTSTSDDSLIGCYVTGGSVQLPGILEGITESLGIDVSILNPFRVLEVDKSFSEEELSEIAYTGCIAIGLGMRQVK